jgi:hypothetical protein
MERAATWTTVRINRTSALAGGAIWAIVAAATIAGRGVGEIGVALALATLVTVPLGLSLVDETGAGRAARLARLAAYVQPVAALAASIALALPPGPAAGLLTAPWLALTTIVALLGLARFLTHRFARAEEVAIDAGLGSPAVGGGWLLASRAGLTPGGFSEPIVALTAAHFHYAGFGALILAGLAGRWQTGATVARRWAYRAIVVGIIAAIPLVAAAISDLLPEPPGAILLTIALLALSALVATIIPRHASPLARLLLTISALAPLLPMALACAYALRDQFPALGLTIPVMVRYHGLVNAIGFVLCGLLGWTVARHAEFDRKTP